MRRNRENGQALILVVLAVGLVLMGGLGLAIDAGQLYGQRQMAQVAADAAAEAGILSIYGGTWSPTASFTCTNGTDTQTPCAYARLNGFGLSTSPSSETVAVDFPTSIPGGGSLSPDFTPAAIHVLITRPVQTSLLRLLGASASKNAKASATAAILKVTSPLPIVVLHPNLASSFSLQGGGSSNSNLKICGGPQKSIQVNSSNAAAVAVGGSQTVDLSKGGPADTSGNCVTGQGTDFGVFGGPATATPTTFPTWMTPTGTKTHYYSHDPPLRDPLGSVPAPTTTGLVTNPATTAATAGTGDCPVTATKNCTIYRPGIYTSGIGIQNTMAIFNPGIYYVSGTGSGTFSGVGFGTQATNSDMIMCSTTCTADTTGCCSAGGMLVYLTSAGGVVNIKSGSNVTLKGSDVSSSYKGILIFGARDAPAHIGTSGSHSINGGGGLSLSGTIYLTNTTMTSSVYQNLQLQGNAGSSTLIRGEIVVSTLSLGGGGTIQMNLDASTSYSINQVALVN